MTFFLTWNINEDGDCGCRKYNSFGSVSSYLKQHLKFTLYRQLWGNLQWFLGKIVITHWYKWLLISEDDHIDFLISKPCELKINALSFFFTWKESKAAGLKCIMRSCGCFYLLLCCPAGFPTVISHHVMTDTSLCWPMSFSDSHKITDTKTTHRASRQRMMKRQHSERRDWLTTDVILHKNPQNQIRGIVHLKINPHPHPHPHVFSNLYDLLFSVEHRPKYV